jgi:hypothetical protein
MKSLFLGASSVNDEMLEVSFLFFFLFSSFLPSFSSPSSSPPPMFYPLFVVSDLPVYVSISAILQTHFRRSSSFGIHEEHDGGPHISHTRKRDREVQERHHVVYEVFQ